MAGEDETDAAAEGGETEKKSGGFLGQLLMGFALGAASFATVYFLPADAPPPVAACETEQMIHAAPVKTEPEPPSLANVVFVELEPLMVSLGHSAEGRHLRIGLTLETGEGQEADIAHAEPKLRDAFTSYLRAVNIEQLEDPAAMTRLRAQLLRRAKVILGHDTVHGVLITDFLVR